jgi:chromosome partitioning protein
VAGISETCSVCGGEFEVQFRYQMEERDNAFSFYCSQKCLEKSQRNGSEAGAGATCDACAKRFQPDLVSQVVYIAGRRNYACSLGCRTQILREAKGTRLGEIAASPEEVPATAPVPVPVSAPTPAPSRASASAPSPRSTRPPRTAAETPASPISAVPAPAPAPPTAPPSAKARAAEPAVAVPVVPQTGKREKVTAAPKPGEGVPRYLAVFNHKGGTGKTTTAVSVAAGLATKGKKVLLVDTDAQGNVGVSLGAGAERSLYHVLVMGLRVADAVKTVRPNLDLLPSNETLAAAELYLAGRQNRDRVLCERLASAAGSYDFVVLDCSPSLSLMNQNALVFADSVLVPVACDYLSLVGVRQVIKTVKNVNSLLHHPVQIWGVLPTFYDARAKICREAVSTLKSHFGERCLPPIRAAIKVKEAPAQGQTIFEYADGSTASDDYSAIVDLIVTSREKGTFGRGEAEGPRPSSKTAVATA